MMIQTNNNTPMAAAVEVGPTPDGDVAIVMVDAAGVAIAVALCDLTMAFSIWHALRKVTETIAGRSSEPLPPRELRH